MTGLAVMFTLTLVAVAALIVVIFIMRRRILPHSKQHTAPTPSDGIVVFILLYTYILCIVHIHTFTHACRFHICM